MLVEYSFETLEDLAQYCDQTAEREASALHGRIGKRAEELARERAAAWRSVADLLRSSKLNRA